MIKSGPLLIILMILLMQCTSSPEHSVPEITDSELPNQISFTSPAAGQETIQSHIYVDSVKRVRFQNRVSLLLMGNLPDACTRIEKITLASQAGLPLLTIGSWRDPQLSCAQVLTPFSLIYRGITSDSLLNTPQVYIGEQRFTIR